MSWRFSSVKTIFLPSVRPKLMQTIIAYPEKMSKLMKNGPLYKDSQLVRCCALGLDGLPVDADLVWGNQAVVSGPLCQGHPVVKTEQAPRRLDTRELKRVPIRPVFDDDLDVLQAITKRCGQRVQSAFDKGVKQFAIHVTIIAPRGPPVVTVRPNVGPSGPDSESLMPAFSMENRKGGKRGSRQLAIIRLRRRGQCSATR